VDVNVREGNVAKYLDKVGEASACVKCHASEETGQSGGASRALDCKLCHGDAATGPADIHAKLAGTLAETPDQRKTLRAKESPEQSRQRREAARAAGMRLATDAWDLAMNCYGCHAVKNEAVVLAGHSEGTRTFELASGCATYPHNFVIPREQGSSESAAASSLAVQYGLSPDAQGRRRQLYVVGQLAKLHVGLGNMAAVADRKSKMGKFATNTLVKKAALELVEIRGQAGDAGKPLDPVIEALRGAGLLVEKSGKVKFCKSSVARDQEKVTSKAIEAVCALIEPAARATDAAAWSFIDASIKSR